MPLSVVFAVLRAGAVAALPMLTTNNNATGNLRPSVPRTSCGPEEIMHAMAMLPSREKTLARNSPCLSDMAPLYELGVEDPADAAEFLGRAGITLDAQCMKKVLPSFLYLGMEHAGSTTLAEELNRHEQLSYGRAKEHRFWTRFGTNVFASTLEEYLDGFRVDCKVTRTFDGTPNLFGLPLETPQQSCHVFLGAEGRGQNAMRILKNALGNQTQLLVMLRDPIKVGQSRFPGKTWEFQLNFAVNFCSCFHAGIMQWMSHFPRKQFHFLRAEYLFQKPQETLNKVFDFLGVHRPEDSHRDFLKSGRRRTAARTSGSMERYLNAIRPCQEKFEALAKFKLPWGTSSETLP